MIKYSILITGLFFFISLTQLNAQIYPTSSPNEELRGEVFSVITKRYKKDKKTVLETNFIFYTKDGNVDSSAYFYKDVRKYYAMDDLNDAKHQEFILEHTPRYRYYTANKADQTIQVDKISVSPNYFFDPKSKDVFITKLTTNYLDDNQFLYERVDNSVPPKKTISSEGDETVLMKFQNNKSGYWTEKKTGYLSTAGDFELFRIDTRKLNGSNQVLEHRTTLLERENADYTSMYKYNEKGDPSYSQLVYVDAKRPAIDKYFEYTYDEQGNWIEKFVYADKENKNTILSYEQRKIEYSTNP